MLQLTSLFGSAFDVFDVLLLAFQHKFQFCSCILARPGPVEEYTCCGLCMSVFWISCDRYFITLIVDTTVVWDGCPPPTSYGVGHCIFFETCTGPLFREFISDSHSISASTTLSGRWSACFLFGCTNVSLIWSWVSTMCNPSTEGSECVLVSWSWVTSTNPSGMKDPCPLRIRFLFVSFPVNSCHRENVFVNHQAQGSASVCHSSLQIFYFVTKYHYFIAASICAANTPQGVQTSFPRVQWPDRFPIPSLCVSGPLFLCWWLPWNVVCFCAGVYLCLQQTIIFLFWFVIGWCDGFCCPWRVRNPCRRASRYDCEEVSLSVVDDGLLLLSWSDIWGLPESWREGIFSALTRIPSYSCIFDCSNPKHFMLTVKGPLFPSHLRASVIADFIPNCFESCQIECIPVCVSASIISSNKVPHLHQKKSSERNEHLHNSQDPELVCIMIQSDPITRVSEEQKHAISGNFSKSDCHQIQSQGTNDLCVRFPATF